VPLVRISIAAGLGTNLLLHLDLLEEIFGIRLLHGEASAYLLNLLLVACRGHAIVEIALGGLAVVLRQSQHVLHLDIFHVLLDQCRCVLLVVTRRQALIEELLGVLAGCSVLLARQTQHSAWADALCDTQLLLLVVAVRCHLLHAL